MARKKSSKTMPDSSLTSKWTKAWEALEPIRSTWDEKEQQLINQQNDSVGGNITATRVSDGALSTLSYERQARVAAQLSTGKFYGKSKSSDKASALLNIVTNRYIFPGADSQYTMLTKLRLWGLYASVYGSMPMFYDYRVDKRYVGPDCWLVDPRCFAPVQGMHDVQTAGCYVSTIMHKSELEAILKRDKTSYDKKAIRKLIDLMKSEGSKPSRDNDANKENTTISQRYDLSNADDRVEIVTKYTGSTWTSFAPDYADIDAGEDMIIREMDNPHKSGRVPVVLRHCFPLLNSIFGLGDFERGMKIQKAKDSVINLFLEGTKNRIFPPLKMIDNQLTPSTIRYQAGSKWKVKQQGAVEPVSWGNAPLNEFQTAYSTLQSILENQFGTSTTRIAKDEGAAAPGKSPQALKMQEARENARDTWDRFMHEQAVQELVEGMANLLTVKMEKPINFAVFEEDIQAMGFEPEQEEVVAPDGTVVQEPRPAKKVEGLEVFESNKTGKLTISKKMFGEGGFTYVIDQNSSMRRNDEDEFQSLQFTWEIMHVDPNLVPRLQEQGTEYDEFDHLKKIFISAGITDWEKILKELPVDKRAQAAMMAQQVQQQQQQEPAMDPNAMMQQLMMQQQMQPPMQQPPMPQQAPAPQPMPGQGFEDPQIAAVAQQMLRGV